MQNIKKIIFCSILIFFAQTCHYTPLVAWMVSKEAAEKLLAEAAKTVAPSMQKTAEALPHLGSEFGSQFGLATTQAIGNGITAAAAAAKSAAVATGTTVKSTAIAVASAPATPYILIGAGVIVVSYGGYKVYRHYHPTQEQIAAALKVQAEIAKHQADIAKFKAEAARSQADEAKYQASIIKVRATAEAFKRTLVIQQREAEFKSALLLNQTSKRNALGIPFACQKEAAYLAMAAGSKKVEKIVDAFNKYIPAPQAA